MRILQANHSPTTSFQPETGMDEGGEKILMLYQAWNFEKDQELNNLII